MVRVIIRSNFMSALRFYLENAPHKEGSLSLDRKKKTMENEAMIISKDLKVELPSHEAPLLPPKHSCLCSPTTHTGSFRWRLHRAVSLHRAKSISSTACHHSQSEVTQTSNMLTQNSAVDAQ
ncbi:hypothetical protein Sango_1013400 [Sesamum angolense]|uniref:Uncharacterized protein n=1 Tax=Sesamum angolense TaxID=2727404 RepID=A0AAE1WZW6_9LAMI|nr:hypothetical protein Sango_1013400 [Sesamum angolense]